MDKEDALDEVVQAQAQLDAVTERFRVFLIQFRLDRDVAIHQAVDAGLSKREICKVLGCTPQWLNRLLKGEAYRRIEG